MEHQVSCHARQLGTSQMHSSGLLLRGSNIPLACGCTVQAGTHRLHMPERSSLRSVSLGIIISGGDRGGVVWCLVFVFRRKRRRASGSTRR